MEGNNNLSRRSDELIFFIMCLLFNCWIFLIFGLFECIVFD